MPKIIKNEDGTEVEVFTPQEVDEKLKAKEAELNSGWETKINETKTALETAMADKKRIEEQMKGGGQGENFKTLKEALDKKDTEINELRTNMQKSEENRINEFRDTLIKKIVGTDKELEKKILFNFNETLKGVTAKNQEEISAKLQAAVKLSMDNVSPSILQNAMNGAGGPGFIPNSSNGPVEFSQTEKALGAKLGISEEDYKKYGPRLKTKK